MTQRESASVTECPRGRTGDAGALQCTDKATPPQKEKSEVGTFQTAELIAIGDAAAKEPIKRQMLIHLLLLRRRPGEHFQTAWTRSGEHHTEYLFPPDRTGRHPVGRAHSGRYFPHGKEAGVTQNFAIDPELTQNQKSGKCKSSPKVQKNPRIITILGFLGGASVLIGLFGNVHHSNAFPHRTCSDFIHIPTGCV